MLNTKKLGTAIATVAILANSFAGVAAASTTITITGNGADSSNGAVVNNSQSTSVNQSNNANFTNNVSGNANTGSNDANKNTGGNVEVKTGDATVNNTVSNQANQNYANVGCCNQGDTLVKVAGNGADSENGVELNNSSSNSVGQSNNANFNNNVSGNAKTGNNDANKNTGGDVSVETGDASVNNHVSNWANGNSARVGGNGNGGDTSLIIKGNGADSDNGIKISNSDSVSLYQSNNADFENNVEGKANSGDNDANRNTGGNVSIETGDASVDSSVENQANFNWADVSCDCTLGDLTASVEENGYDSDNAIEANFGGSQSLGQDNNANFDNDLDCIFAETGNNDANKNTGYDGSDPSVETGDAEVNSEVSNSANLNGIGEDQPEWPNFDMGNGVHVSVNFNLNDLLASLGL